jgi:hypothetical protein
MTSEETWNFPDTLEGFGYAFNKGKIKCFLENKRNVLVLCWTMDKILMYKLGFLLLSESCDHFPTGRND